MSSDSPTLSERTSSLAYSVKAKARKALERMAENKDIAVPKDVRAAYSHALALAERWVESLYADDSAEPEAAPVPVAAKTPTVRKHPNATQVLSVTDGTAGARAAMIAEINALKLERAKLLRESTVSDARS